MDYERTRNKKQAKKNDVGIHLNTSGKCYRPKKPHTEKSKT